MSTEGKFQLPSPPSAFPFESRYVKVDGFRIHYLEVGEGEPVLFFHGNPTSSYLWRNVIGPVAEATSRRVIAFDLLGFGKSDKPAVQYTLKLHAEIVAGFIRRLGLKRLILVGDDWGGPLAANYALRHRDDVQGLALMESFLWPMTWEDDFEPKFRVPFKLMRSPLGYLFTQVFNIMIKKLIPENCPISPEALNHYIESCPTVASRKAIGSFPKLLPVGGKPKASHDFFLELQEGLKSFQTPVLWIKATPGVVPSDDYPPQRKRLSEVQALLPHMVIRQFGPGHHFLAEERPERVAELVSEWIAEIRQGA
ncbi:MAG TPA: alpha/beta fold hydrolase [Methylococcaceae bacterium]|nr:alpha/beta fold hydrolase [Methylococcaceae bacterium]